MVVDVSDGWMQKPWSVTEEMWKRKAKGLEDQYQRLLSDHQELRLEKAKITGELRVLQRYKETSDDMVTKEVTTRKYVYRSTAMSNPSLNFCFRRIEHKEKISAQTKLEQYMKKYERVRLPSMHWTCKGARILNTQRVYPRNVKRFILWNGRIHFYWIKFPT